MIYIAIPTITPRLERCALEAIERTTPEPHRVIVARGGSHGENLDRAFGKLPDDAEWFFTCDDDAAPLRVGWVWSLWLTVEHQKAWAITFGENAVVGALYRVDVLRRIGLSFASAHSLNPGDDIWRQMGSRPVIRRVFDGPWWLRNCEAYRDPEGRLLFAHLGGGTIGHTWLHKGRLYPRIPTWLWPYMVRRHLDREGAPPARDRGRDAGGRWPLVVDRAAGTRDG